MYTLSMKLQRTEHDREQTLKDRKEAAKNPLVPGARIIRGQDAVPVYNNLSACREWCYPLSEVNDLGFFSYIEKKKSTDKDRPWTLQAHPGVNCYLYILAGEGRIILNEKGKAQEIYSFEEQELVVVPRNISYRMEGEWNAICFHARTGVYGTIAGNERYPHPVWVFEKSRRPTKEEEGIQPEAGSLLYFDQVFSHYIEVGKQGQEQEYNNLQWVRKDLEQAHEYDINALYREITPIDEQTIVKEVSMEAEKNADIIGARILKRVDAPDVYNANGGLKQACYPLTWTDDIAICNLIKKLASSDIDRPFDSHSHPDIEEYKFILSGSGSMTIGVGDETCEEETYEFQAGDLVILPRGLPHVDAGGFEALVFHTKQSVFGKVPGDSLYPHIAYVYTRPKRPTKEEEAALNDPGTFIKMNSRETYNVYCPNPIERVEKNPTDMTYLRPDLFEKE